MPRARPRSAAFASAFLGACAIFVCTRPAPRAESAVELQAGLWRTDYASALAAARAQDRPVLALFRGRELALGAELEREFDCDPELACALRERCVGVALDPDEDAALFARLFGRPGRLAACVIDQDGEPAAELEGFADARTLADFLGRAERALPELRAARELAALAPEDPDALESLALAYERAGSPLRAERAFAAALAHGAGADASAHAARLAALAGRNLDARAALESARDAGTADGAQLAFTEALILEVERKPRDAARLLGDTLARFPDAAERDAMRLALARAQRDSGAPDAALADLAALCAERPGTIWQARAEACIASIRAPAHGHPH